MPATIPQFVTNESPTDEADAIALEHIAWAKKANLSPCHVLRSIGCRTDYGSRANWNLVRTKLRLWHICRVQPLLNAQDRKENAA